MASTNLSYTATGLAPNTTYYFTFRGTNAGGNLWATNVLGFTTAALPPAPVLWLGFNGGWANSGTSTNNHVVSHLGSAVLSNVVANSGCGSGSVYLPGTAASYVAVTNVSDLNFNTGSAFTLCAWINTSTPGVIAAKSTPGGSSANHTPAFYVDTSGVLRYDVFYVNTVTSSATVTSGQWTHVAVTCDGTTYRLYINGAPDGAKAFGGANDPGTWDFTVGLTRNGTFPQPNGAANGPFAGDIDEVAVWNSALSPNQLAYVYQNGVSLPIPAALAATAATGITTTSATLHGTLACTGTNAAVLAFWNTVNGGTNAALWTNSAYVGSWTNVASTNLSLQVSGLIPQTEDENAKMGPFCCSPR